MRRKPWIFFLGGYQLCLTKLNVLVILNYIEANLICLYIFRLNYDNVMANCVTLLQVGFCRNNLFSKNTVFLRLLMIYSRCDLFHLPSADSIVREKSDVCFSQKWHSMTSPWAALCMLRLRNSTTDWQKVQATPVVSSSMLDPAVQFLDA